MKPITAEQFLSMPSGERLRWFRAMAGEAAKLSAASQSSSLRTVYRDLARQLSTVADEISREVVICQTISREIRQSLH